MKRLPDQPLPIPCPCWVDACGGTEVSRIPARIFGGTATSGSVPLAKEPLAVPDYGATEDHSPFPGATNPLRFNRIASEHKI
jgi:hypothetical protein